MSVVMSNHMHCWNTINFQVNFSWILLIWVISFSTGNLKEENRLCVERAQLVEVGQNTSIDFIWDSQDHNL